MIVFCKGHAIVCLSALILFDLSFLRFILKISQTEHTKIVKIS